MDKENLHDIEDEREASEEVRILTEEEYEALTEEERQEYVLSISAAVLKKYRRAFEELAKN